MNVGRTARPTSPILAAFAALSSFYLSSWQLQLSRSPDTDVRYGIRLALDADTLELVQNSS